MIWIVSYGLYHMDRMIYRLSIKGYKLYDIIYIIRTSDTATFLETKHLDSEIICSCKFASF